MSEWWQWSLKKDSEAQGFAVVGIGRFGTAVCRELLKNGADPGNSVAVSVASSYVGFATQLSFIGAGITVSTASTVGSGNTVTITFDSTPRMGISTGFCTVGNFGSDLRLDYTVLGSPVNLAARLQSAAERNGILIDTIMFEYNNSITKNHITSQYPMKGKNLFTNDVSVKS